MGTSPDPLARSRTVALVLFVALVGVLVAVRLVSDGQEQSGAAIPAVRDTASDVGGGDDRAVVRPVRPEPAPVPDEALAGIRFEDVTARSGLAGSGPATPEPTAADTDAGVAVADLDDDGDLDLLLTSSGRASGLYRNEGGTFVDVTRRSGLPRLAAVTTAAFADVDGDGHLDVFLGGPAPGFGRLYLDDGTGRFRDRSGDWGLAVAARGQRSMRGADFGDVDRDGDLDLVVTDWNIGSFLAVEAALGDASDRVTGQCGYAATVRRLHAAGSLEVTGHTRAFRNEGDRFVDATREWGLSDLGIERPFTPQLVDLDDDGWLDLAVAGDSCSSRLYRNDGGTGFVDVTRRAGVGTDENGMGSVVRDLDGDGRPDWLVTSIAYPTADGTCPPVGLFAGCSGNRVYLNRGRMRFEEATDELGLRDTGWGWVRSRRTSPTTAGSRSQSPTAASVTRTPTRRRRPRSTTPRSSGTPRRSGCGQTTGRTLRPPRRSASTTTESPTRSSPSTTTATGASTCWWPMQGRRRRSTATPPRRDAGSGSGSGTRRLRATGRGSARGSR